VYILNLRTRPKRGGKWEKGTDHKHANIGGLFPNVGEVSPNPGGPFPNVGGVSPNIGGLFPNVEDLRDRPKAPIKIGMR
jgi:hypothetical protein